MSALASRRAIGDALGEFRLPSKGAISLAGTPTTATQTVSTGGSLVIPLPAGTQAGDVLFFSVEVNNANNVPATPAGLTLDQSAGVSLGPSFATYYRVCDGTEPASYSWTVATYASGTGRAYRGVNTVTPINASGAPNRTTTGAGATAVSITTTKDGCELIFATGVGNNLVVTAPTGFANQAAVNLGSPQNVTSASSDEKQASAGATGAVVAGGTTGNKWANLTALQPA